MPREQKALFDEMTPCTLTRDGELWSERLLPFGTDRAADLAHTAANLSSGTIATVSRDAGLLIGRATFEAIDVIQAAFVEFCRDRGSAYETWQDAWISYAETARD